MRVRVFPANELHHVSLSSVVRLPHGGQDCCAVHENRGTNQSGEGEGDVIFLEEKVRRHKGSHKGKGFREFEGNKSQRGNNPSRTSYKHTSASKYRIVCKHYAGT